MIGRHNEHDFHGYYTIMNRICYATRYQYVDSQKLTVFYCITLKNNQQFMNYIFFKDLGFL